MLLGGIPGREAQHIPGMREIPIAPFVVGVHEEDVMPDRLVRVDGEFDGVDD